MSASVRWEGLDEFLREMHALPKNLHSEGMEIIRTETEGAAAEIRQTYPGHQMAAKVVTEYPSTTILIGKVLSKAPHSHLYEFGTDKRRTFSGRNRGYMHGRALGEGRHGKAVTVPIVRRRRARMARQLVDLLRRMGFEIGNA